MELEIQRKFIGFANIVLFGVTGSGDILYNRVRDYQKKKLLLQMKLSQWQHVNLRYTVTVLLGNAADTNSILCSRDIGC